MRLPAPALLLICLLPLAARSSAREAWTFDPQLLLARSEAVIAHAPDTSLDQLFQAVAEAAREPGERRAMCALFDPQARRDLAAINRAALQFGAASQRRFQSATDALLAAADGPVQPWDRALAERALRQAAVTAAMLHDGFVAALDGQGRDATSRQARCRALRQLLDALSMRPLRERAMVTRLLMREGLRRLEGQDASAATNLQERREPRPGCARKPEVATSIAPARHPAQAPQVRGSDRGI